VLCSSMQCGAVQILPLTLLSRGNLARSDEEAKRGGERSSVCETCISRYAPPYSIIYYRCRTVQVRCATAPSEQNQPTTA
jgi:hypothetical protein